MVIIVVTDNIKVTDMPDVMKNGLKLHVFNCRTMTTCHTIRRKYFMKRWKCLSKGGRILLYFILEIQLYEEFAFISEQLSNLEKNRWLVDHLYFYWYDKNHDTIKRGRVIYQGYDLYINMVIRWLQSPSLS